MNFARPDFIAAGFCACPAFAAPMAFVDGQTFAGWEGETNSVWRIARA